MSRKIRKYPYVTHWKYHDRDNFRLVGVIVADDEQLLGYYPNDPDKDMLKPDEEDPLDPDPPMESLSPRAIREALREISESGNGINEEFDDVLQIEASSIEEAARRAFVYTVQTKGEIVPIAGEPEPLAGVEVLDPWRL